MFSLIRLLLCNQIEGENYGKEKILFISAVAGFWITGTTGQIFFRLSSDTPEYHLLYFILGCITSLGTSGTAMVAFALMKNANIVTLLLYGCSFVVGQTAMWLCFHSALTLWQIIGTTMIVIGTIMGTMGGEQKE